MNFDESLNFIFAEITNSFWVEMEKTLRQTGVHSGQIFLLISLWKEDAQPQIELARKLNLSPPTINNMVKSLKKNGFVRTKRNHNDARIVQVYLTESGLNVRESVEKAWTEFEQTFFSGLSETEKLIIRQVFDKLKESGK